MQGFVLKSRNNEIVESISTKIFDSRNQTSLRGPMKQENIFSLIK